LMGKLLLAESALPPQKNNLDENQTSVE
jgi:hypothetical protein